MKYILSSVTLLLVPMLVSAQFGPIDTFFINILDFINGILVPVIFALALLVFLYGMFKFFILGGSDETERNKGKQLVLWAIIGFVLMVSIWGIVNMIATGLFGTTSPPTLPGTPTL